MAFPIGSIYKILAGVGLYAGRPRPVAPPVPNFIGAPLSGTVPFAVTFTDLSVGQVTSWAWNFGDGTTSSSQNPTKVYSTAGTYDVTLVVNGPGGTRSLTRSAYVAASATAPPPPPPVATQLTLTGSATGITGASTTFTVTPNNQLGATCTVNILAPGATLSTSTLTFPAGSSAAQTFTVTLNSPGTVQISISNSLGLTNVNSPFSYTASAAPPAPSLTWSAPGPATGTVNVASGNFVATLLNGTGSVVVTPSSSAAGTWSPTTRTLTPAAPSGTFTFTPTAVGPHTINLANNAGITPPAAVTYTATAVTATQFTLSGPTSGVTGSATTFTVTPNGALSATTTVNISAPGATASVASLTFNTGTNAPQTFTVTRATDGTTNVSITSTLAVVGSPIAFATSSGTPTGTPAAFTLLSAQGGTLPFTTGYLFRKGDVPSGANIAVAGATAQVTVKNRWPDGSVRHAIIAGTYTSTANVAATVTPSVGTASSGTALTTADLQAALTQPVSIGCGAFGTATWTGSDWASPFITWATGHRMSSWIYRKPVGTDTHLVAWLEVRLYAAGAVEIVPWIENGYLKVSAPSNRNETYTFTMGGTQRESLTVNLLSRQRTPLLSGSKLSHWLGTDPGVTAYHSPAYMKAAKAVPDYMATTADNAAAVTSLPSSFTPLMQSLYPTTMGTAGYHPSIGPLPEWDMLYIVTSNTVKPTVHAAIERMAYAAGRYGIHYRDENTNRPLRFSQHATLCMNGSTGVTNTGNSSTGNETTANTGPAPTTYTNTHAPELGYMAYLLTGRFYHLETLQFQACVNYLKQGDIQRQGANGIFLSEAGSNTTRGAGWAWRTLARTAFITPDDDVLKAEFTASYIANVNFYHQRYVFQDNCPQGFVFPYSDYTGVGDGRYHEAIWMQDFVTYAMGQGLSLEITANEADQVKERQLFHWKARSVVGRFGTTHADHFLYRDAANYTMPIAPSDTPNWSTGAGPWYATWGALYDAAVASGAAFGPRTDGDLRGGNFPDATSYWGNLMPALAMAVEHGVAGAIEAWRRMTSAPNWNTLATNFNGSPVWSMQPLGGYSRPAWVTSAPLWTWTEIPNSAMSLAPPSKTITPGDPQNKINAWCGAALRTKGSVYIVGAAGGHADYAGNEVNALFLNQATPQVVEYKASTDKANIINFSPFYLDLSPGAAHTYWMTQFMQTRDQLYIGPRGGISFASGQYPDPPVGWAYPVSDDWPKCMGWTTKDWKTPGYVAKHPGIGSSDHALAFMHQYTNHFYCSPSYNATVGWQRWHSVRNEWVKLSSASASPWYAGSICDPTRNRVLKFGGFTPVVNPGLLDLNGNGISFTFTGLGPSALLCDGYPGGDYDEMNDLFVVAFNASGVIEVRTVHAGTGVVASPALGTKPAARPNGIQNSFRYAPELGGFVIWNAYTQNAKFLRTS